MIVTEILAS